MRLALALLLAPALAGVPAAQCETAHFPDAAEVSISGDVAAVVTPAGVRVFTFGPAGVWVPGALLPAGQHVSVAKDYGGKHLIAVSVPGSVSVYDSTGVLSATFSEPDAGYGKCMALG